VVILQVQKCIPSEATSDRKQSNTKFMATHRLLLTTEWAETFIDGPWYATACESQADKQTHREALETQQRLTTEWDRMCTAQMKPVACSKDV
jgi:hypothetical protein